jgi:hypothetical protein
MPISSEGLKFCPIPTWTKLTLLLGAAYSAGLVLTPLSPPWGLVQLLLRKGLKMSWEWKEGPSRGDEIIFIATSGCSAIQKRGSRTFPSPILQPVAPLLGRRATSQRECRFLWRSPAHLIWRSQAEEEVFQTAENPNCVRVLLGAPKFT